MKSPRNCNRPDELSGVFEPREVFMGNTSDKASGIGNEALGRSKQVIGKRADDDNVRA